MPKQTFLNLPEEKRNRILEAAMDDFAERGYKEASISRIVAAAGIAKGSFYQYFADKDDLYIHIVTHRIVARKFQAFEEEKGKLEVLSLTGFLRIVFQRIFREFQEDLRVMRIGMDLLGLVREPVYQKLFERYQGQMVTFFSPFIHYEIEQGELDPKVNVRLLNFMLFSLGQYISALLAEGAGPMTPELIDRVVDDLEYIFTYGIYGKVVE